MGKSSHKPEKSQLINRSKNLTRKNIQRFESAKQPTGSFIHVQILDPSKRLAVFKISCKNRTKQSSKLDECASIRVVLAASTTGLRGDQLRREMGYENSRNRNPLPRPVGGYCEMDFPRRWRETPSRLQQDRCVVNNAWDKAT